ncbi:DEAD/DEAH box helicase family protein [Alicyclobacillus dauci]|uniref:DNA 3'-5' helicase n=1 Tax=Alicyclobacillus dauci TaxID=1475485 RepID=A0ABY6YX97_9BACL|nr:DEAD/DEAH box helicase family protein [Alicyclobacillus dauci]WAH35131.1 DEAD/DEAH box helicase [Alicyclobacillus dauci]
MYVHDVDSVDRTPAILDLHQFAERIQAMPPIHVYQITNERLWGACREGLTALDVIQCLRNLAAAPLPLAMQTYIVNTMKRFECLAFVPHPKGLRLVGEPQILQEIQALPSVSKFLKRVRSGEVIISKGARFSVKMALAAENYSIREDERTGAEEEKLHLDIWLREHVTLRPYQARAVDAFTEQETTSGVMVLPCGAGKTVVGVGVMTRLKLRTLVLVPNEAAAAQWYTHIVKWTTLREEDVCIDDGKGDLRPVTITTYQRLTAKRRSGEYHQFHRYTESDWGLIIYDEVHLLPAPLFRFAADLQGARRLGLSATLIREDGRASDVFSLVGPKCFEIYAEDLVREGYLSHVRCTEVRVPLDDLTRQKYEQASVRMRHRIAADNKAKLDVVKDICAKHRADQILIMGHYTAFLAIVADAMNCPMLSGETPRNVRLETYERFRAGELPILVLSRIANVAVDLPNADVAIQISGLFGSRQEEAQRLGRLLRPKAQGGHFYTLVSDGTIEEKTAAHRQRFLVEHGFAYNQCTAADFSEGTNEIETQ